MELLSSIVQAFVTIFVIMDPFASVGVFHSMTRSLSPKKRAEAARTAVFSAGAALLAFIAVGPFLLNAMGISLDHFKIAGGVILFLIALEFVLGISFPREKKKTDLAIVVIGVPLITGPGVLTASILLATTVGYVVTVIAALIALLITIIILWKSEVILKFLGDTGSEIFSRIMGLLLAAIAVQFILSGLAAINAIKPI